MINLSTLTAREVRVAARQAKDMADRAQAADLPRLAAMWGTLAARLAELASNRPDADDTPEPEIFT